MAKTKDADKKQSPAADAPAWPLARPDYASLEAAVQGEASRWNIPGMSVAVLHEGQILTAATGITSIESRQPVTADTIFQIGSISKTFTATLAMQLVDEGKLDLDTPIVTWVPELPLADEDVRKSVTLRHIFSHSSGFEGDTFDDYGRGDDAVLKAIAEFGKLEQWFRPGEYFSYNNNGFVLAAAVIERVTGQQFEALVEERIFKPLKLENTVYFAENAITYPHALGHFLKKRADGLQLAKPYSFPRQINAPGGIIGTASDLVRFAQAHSNGGELDGERILSEEITTMMQTPFINSWDQYTSFGQGWYIAEYPGLKVVQHGGATNGFRAILRFAPDRGFAFAALTNAEPGASAYDSVWEWALKHYLDFDLPKDVEVERPENELDTLTGTYGRQNMRVEVTRDESSLVVRPYQIDPETGKEKEDGPLGDVTTLTIEPIVSTRVNDFHVVGGPMDGVIINFIPVVSEDDPDRMLIRVGGRVAARIKTEAADV